MCSQISVLLHTLCSNRRILERIQRSTKKLLWLRSPLSCLDGGPPNWHRLRIHLSVAECVQRCLTPQQRAQLQRKCRTTFRWHPRFRTARSAVPRHLCFPQTPLAIVSPSLSLGSLRDCFLACTVDSSGLTPICHPAEHNFCKEQFLQRNAYLMLWMQKLKV